MSSYSLTTGTTNGSGQSIGHAHNLSTTPDTVMIVQTNTTPDNWAVANITATTVDIYCGTAAAEPYNCVAVKVS